MKRLLIVSPHFPPINAADCHRVRMYVPYLRQYNWEPVVLSVDPEFVDCPRDELLLAGLPADLEIHRTRAWPVSFTGLWGSRTIGRRCYRFVRRAGDALLAANHFDLVFFSTTAFSVFRLGPRWRRRFGVPFVIDLQDPWVNPYYELHPAVTPPGGRLRYYLASRMARRWEPVVARAAAGIVTVSPAYRDDWIGRYRLPASRFTVLPFGGSRNDFDIVSEHAVEQRAFRPAAGVLDVVYVGRGGADLAASFDALLRAFAAYRREEPAQAERFRFHFIGTSYADENRIEPSVEPLAAAIGLAGQVHEQPRRIPYFEALKCLVDASGLVLPTSADSGYNASKIANCLLSGKPLLVIGSDGGIMTRDTTGWPGVTVAAAESYHRMKGWFRELAVGGAVPIARRVDELDAEALSAELCGFFDRQVS